MNKMRVIAHGSVCAGHTLCNAECEEVFGLDDVGHVQVLIEGPIPADLESRVRLGVDACPERAIEIVEN